ncbi:MAG: pyridoxamine 5'-phosphate oxidase family protein [Candidatus Aminicenantes bacterium]|nr:pyridoxamine 5'-phosphate oxidase family protein [Candidatus Aminicenantes bacterium]
MFQKQRENRLQKKDKTKKEISKLFAGQPLAVLATQSKDAPHLSLIAFVSSPDLKRIFFVTNRSTHKFKHLKENPRVSLLMDNRSNRAEDFQTAAAVSVYGKAKEIPKSQNKKFVNMFTDEHPSLKDFIRSPDSALVQVTVDKYSLVSQFQNVQEIIL